MSAQDAAASSAIPPVARALEPTWIRNGSAQVQREYALGLEFEQLLVRQLATSLTENGEAGTEGETEGGGEASSSVLKSMLPGALADGVTAGGGLGLAAEMARQMQGLGGASTAQSGGTAPAGAAAQRGGETSTSGGVSA